jgi:aminocarboxymuconate-semialdehyde decarboxylase
VAPEKYLGHFYVDSLVHDANALKYLIELFGAEKICLGTDYPFPLGEEIPGELINKTITDKETRDWLNYRSAQAWLGI